MLVGLTLLRRLGFFQLVLQPADPVTDNFQVGKEKLLAKLAQLRRQVAAAVAVQDDEQPVRFTEYAQATRIVAPLRGQQARRVEEFNRGRRGLLRPKVGRQPVQACVGDARDADLPALTGRRIRLDARQPLENRALSRSRKARDADFHEENQ